MRIFIACLLIVSVLLPAQGQTNQRTPKIGIVLGGGGAKGFVHIGVLKVLEEEGLPIDLIVGTSIGGVVGGLAAAGYSPEEIDTLSRAQNWEEMLSDATPRTYLSNVKQKRKERYLVELPLVGNSHSLTIPSGAVAGQNVLNTFTRLLANVPPTVNFDSLAIPFCAISTSLLTGHEMDIRQGNLPKAMLSSMCVPGVFRPVQYGNDLMVDGGVLNNFPTDVAKKMGADIIIGVDLRKEFKAGDEITSFGDVAGQLMNIVDLEKNTYNRTLCNILIEPDLTGYEATSFSPEAVKVLIARGEAAARAHLPEIRALIKQYHLKPRPISKKYVEKRSWLITNLVLPKEFENEKSFINNRMGVKLNHIYTGEEINDLIAHLYGYGNFELVTYQLQPNPVGYTLVLELKNKYTSALRAGFSLNTSEKAVVNLNYAYESYRRFLNLFSIDAKISNHPRGIMTLETHQPHFPTAGIQLGVFSNPVNAYYKSTILGDYDILGINASMYTYKRFFDVFNVGLGVKAEYFHSEMFLKYNITERLPSYILAKANLQNYLLSPYAFLSFDNLDDYYIPTRGHEFNASFQLSGNKSSLPSFTTIIAMRYRSVLNISNRIDLLGSLNIRSVYSNDSIVPALNNYASNPYNSYTDYNFDLLGQSGLGFLDQVSGLAALQLRFRLGKAYYISPIFQVLSQQALWDNFSDIHFNIAYGVNFTMPTAIGPIDVTFGYNDLSQTKSLAAGLGFRF